MERHGKDGDVIASAVEEDALLYEFRRVDDLAVFSSHQRFSETTFPGFDMAGRLHQTVRLEHE